MKEKTVDSILNTKATSELNDEVLDELSQDDPNDERAKAILNGTERRRNLDNNKSS